MMMLRLGVLALAFVVSTGARQPALDARPGEFVWHDLVTDNPAASRAFYGALFGWRFENMDGVDPGYTAIIHNNAAIGGIVHRRDGVVGGPAVWLPYVVVPDVDRAADAFMKAGGRVYRGPLSARKDLRVAAVSDAQGAAVGLTNRGPRQAAAASAGLNDWLWMEYVARDPESALSFYADVFGYTHEVAEQREGFVYHVFSNDKPRAGLFKTLANGDTSRWLPYVRVDDPVAMALRAERLGGSVVVRPGPRIRNNSLAIILDSTGAPLALQKYPFDQQTTARAIR